MADTLTPFIASLKTNTTALANLATALANDLVTAPVVDSAMIGVKQARDTIEKLFLDPSNKALLAEFEDSVLVDDGRRVDLQTKLFPKIAEFVDTVFTKGAATDKSAMLDAMVKNGDALQGITGRLTAGTGVASLAATIAPDPVARVAMIHGLRDNPKSAGDVVTEIFADGTSRNALKVKFRDDPGLRTEILNILINEPKARDSLADVAAKDANTRAAIRTNIKGTPAFLKDEIEDLLAPGSRDAVFAAILGDPATRKAFFAAAAADTLNNPMADVAFMAIKAGAPAVTPLVTGLVTDNGSEIVLDTFALILSTLGNPGPLAHFVKHIVDAPVTDPLRSQLKSQLNPAP
jgi:hypothetical protein